MCGAGLVIGPADLTESGTLMPTEPLTRGTSGFIPPLRRGGLRLPLVIGVRPVRLRMSSSSVPSPVDCGAGARGSCRFVRGHSGRVGGSNHAVLFGDGIA